MIRASLVVAGAAALALVGCGSSKLANPDSAGRSVSADAPEPGTVVSATTARRAVERSGFRIRWRRGPTPKPFVASLYGTADGKHGISVNFGFLFAGDTDAGGLNRPSLLKLVPHATEEGSTVGISVVDISSGGSRGGASGSTRVEEEFHIANTLERRVAKLAPVAHATEGP